MSEDRAKMALVIIRYMDAFANNGGAEIFPPQPSTASWEEYSPSEQATARIAVNAALAAVGR